MKVISIDELVINIVNEYPDIIQPLVDIGFVHLGNPTMLSVVGKVMTIRKAARNHNFSLSEIKEKLNQNGFEVKEAIE